MNRFSQLARSALLLFLPGAVLGKFSFTGHAASACEDKPNALCFDCFFPKKAPPPADLMLKPGDRIAVCGDSITGQKMCSCIIETYRTVCTPNLDVTAALTVKIRAPLAWAIKTAFVLVTHTLRIEVE